MKYGDDDMFIFIIIDIDFGIDDVIVISIVFLYF